MPTYDYKCNDCGYRFEKFQNIKDNPVEKCPKCGGRTKRLIGIGAGIIFKGNGFYHTDYRIKDDKRGNKEDRKKDRKEKELDSE